VTRLGTGAKGGLLSDFEGSEGYEQSIRFQIGCRYSNRNRFDSEKCLEKPSRQM
jgi:hypothetical protein